MRVIIIGGDGFCGWPTALHLSDIGYEVAIIDNLSRRKIDVELGCASLTPIESIDNRLIAWQEVSNKKIHFSNIDVGKDFHQLKQYLSTFKPDAVVHFGEQRAAPYSMKSADERNYTVNNNIAATHNLLSAIVDIDPGIKIVHLGTMGVYGYGTAGMTVPEGYLPIKLDKEGELIDHEILYPTNPGSIYHMTKSLDQLLFQFYKKNWDLQITDLHQGIVWGTQTSQTKRDVRLINRFDYDGDYGTVLNRFLMQAAIGYPLTVHGTGGQTRAFIHISDTVRCIELALKDRSSSARVKILNQMTETHRVRDLANMISETTGVPIANVSNPRKEDAENELIVSNDKFIALGLNPTKLSEGLMEEVNEITIRYQERCDKSKIPCVSTWT